MLNALVLVALLASPPTAADTTVDVRPGDRLVVEGLTGSLVVQSWGRDAVEVVGEDDERVGIRRTGSSISVVGASDGRRRRSVDAIVRVPAWMDVTVESRSMDVAVIGVGGSVEIRNVSGDVAIQDVNGPVDVRSVDGTVVVSNARGGVRASSQSDDVMLDGVEGAVEAHSGDGDIVLNDVRSGSVRAEAQDGDILFRGPLTEGGDYGFYLHDGDATIAVPESTSARVRVSTFDGEFESDFTVRVERFTSGRQFEFTLGTGSARMEIEVFDGDIRLVRMP